MVVHAHTRFASDPALSSPLIPPSKCISVIFSVGGGEDKALIISKFALSNHLPINNATYTIYVSLFSVYVHANISVDLYVVV